MNIINILTPVHIAHLVICILAVLAVYGERKPTRLRKRGQTPRGTAIFEQLALLGFIAAMVYFIPTIQ